MKIEIVYRGGVLEWIPSPDNPMPDIVEARRLYRLWKDWLGGENHNDRFTVNRGGSATQIRYADIERIDFFDCG